jgi:hypothetical protein
MRIDISVLIDQLIAKTSAGVFANTAAQHYWSGHRDAVAAAVAHAAGMTGTAANDHVMRALHEAKPEVI